MSVEVNQVVWSTSTCTVALQTPKEFGENARQVQDTNRTVLTLCTNVID